MTKKNRRIIAWAASTGMLALALAGCSGQSADAGSSAGATTASAANCSSIDLSKAPKDPVELRFGHGTAAEEQIYLMQASTKTTPNAGKWYKPTYSTVKASSDRLTALQAGQLDGASLSIQPIIVAVAKNVPISVVAAEANEDAKNGFTSKFVAKKGSGITSIKDLKGKTIGIPDYGTASDFWAKSAVVKAGLNPDRDVKYALVPLASQFDALKNGTIDVANLVEPFYTMAEDAAPGQLVTVFDSITGSGITPQPLQNAVFTKSFIAQHTGAVCAWLADFKETTKYYLAHTAEAKKTLLAAKVVVVPADVYLRASDWARPADGKVDLASLDALITGMKKLGVMDKSLAVTAKDMVYPGVSLTK